MDPVILLLSLPLGILIGLGAGIVGLTAWPIIVPLLFVIADVPLQESLLSSLLVDLAIAVTLTLFYVQRSESEVNIPLGTRLGLVAGITATITAIIAFPILGHYSPLFRGGSPIITLVLGALFLVQGIRMRAPISKSPQENQNGRMPALSISQKHLLSYMVCVLIGFLTGAIAIGGAMNFVIVLVFFLGYRTFRAVGTAMVATTIMLSMTVLVYLSLLSFTISTLLVVSLYICGGVLSSRVAVTKAQYIPERKLRIIIGLVVISTALFASVQVYLLG